MEKKLDAVQSWINKFDEKINTFVRLNEVQLDVEALKSSSGLHWNNYSFKLRSDLPVYGLKLDESQGILSYCTHFEEVMGEVQATFNGHKRLVLMPENANEIMVDTPSDVWFFISHEKEMDRFIAFLTVAKKQARPFI